MSANWKVIAATGWGFGFGCLLMVGVGAQSERFELLGNMKLFGEDNGIIFTDGTKPRITDLAVVPWRPDRLSVPQCAGLSRCSTARRR